MKQLSAIIRGIGSLKHMIHEMNTKGIELKRITKTASLLFQSGLSVNSIDSVIIERCLKEQHPDGGWVSIVDTMWNTFFLSRVSEKEFSKEIEAGILFLQKQKNSDGLWGRSKRDMSRIPVTGILLYLFPELAEKSVLIKLEKLWSSEINSLTYKAGYTLMAFKKNNYIPINTGIIEDTLIWLQKNQRNNGGFGPWKEHPVKSDIFCTSIAVNGLIQYPELVDKKVFIKAHDYLVNTQLKNGIWPFHEIEDGASWAVFTLHMMKQIISGKEKG